MRLGAKVVKNYANINNFSYANQWEIRSAEANSLYFQLVDLDMVDCSSKQPLRYIPTPAGNPSPPPAAPTVSVTFPSIDDANQLTIAAVQVDTQDGSLWRVDLTNLQIPSSGNVVFTVTDNGVTRKFSMLNFLTVENPGNDGCC